MERMIELRFYTPLDRKWLILEIFLLANLRSTEDKQPNTTKANNTTTK